MGKSVLPGNVMVSRRAPTVLVAAAASVTTPGITVDDAGMILTSQLPAAGGWAMTEPPWSRLIAIKRVAIKKMERKIFAVYCGNADGTITE